MHQFTHHTRPAQVDYVSVIKQNPAFLENCNAVWRYWENKRSQTWSFITDIIISGLDWSYQIGSRREDKFSCCWFRLHGGHKWARLRPSLSNMSYCHNLWLCFCWNYIFWFYHYDIPSNLIRWRNVSETCRTSRRKIPIMQILEIG